MSKNIIILQHIDIETPGYILDLMNEDNFNLTTIELDQGEKIPSNLNQFDGMFCMGGPMDTWMEKDCTRIRLLTSRVTRNILIGQTPQLKVDL